MKSSYFQLKHKLQEVYFIEPNDLGNSKLTAVYKVVTSTLKQMPFIFIVPLSFVISCVLYLIFGSLTVKLTSLLQYGF